MGYLVVLGVLEIKRLLFVRSGLSSLSPALVCFDGCETSVGFTAL